MRKVSNTELGHAAQKGDLYRYIARQFHPLGTALATTVLCTFNGIELVRTSTSQTGGHDGDQPRNAFDQAEHTAERGQTNAHRSADDHSWSRTKNDRTGYGHIVRDHVCHLDPS